MSKFLKNTSGNLSMIFGIMAVPLFLGAGVAIDLARVQHTTTVLQGAVDAAALAAGSSTDKSDANLDKIIHDYLKANAALDVLQNVTVVEKNLDTNKGTLTVKIGGTIPGSIMSMFGFKDIAVGAISVVNVASQALELALVLDNTGSMAGTKITNLKSAAKNLVKIIEGGASGNGNTKIAVVPFAEYVNVGIGNASKTWLDSSSNSKVWKGCVGSRPSPYNTSLDASGGSYPAVLNVPCNSALLPLTTNFDAVRSAIGAMTASGSTYIPGGLIWGWNVLDSAAPFTEGTTKAQLKKINGKKAMVLMTDGENTVSVKGKMHNGNDSVAANSAMAATCKAAKADGIDVFTISFMVGTKVVEDLLRNCATTPAKYYDADDANELNAAFDDIANDLAGVRLSQ